MNKKVKALSVLRTQLVEKCQAAEQNRDKLIELFKQEVLQGMDLSSLDSDEGGTQLEKIQALWKQKDQQNKQELETLRSQMQALQSNGSAPAPANGEGEGWRSWRHKSSLVGIRLSLPTNSDTNSCFAMLTGARTISLSS